MEIIEETPKAATATAPRRKKTDNNSAFNIKDIAFLLVHNWYWFVLSLGVTLSIAFLQIARTVPIYQRTVSLMLRDESKGTMQSNVDLSEMGIIQQTTNMDNEILSFKSLDLMSDVIETLGLNNIYSIKEGLRSRELYRESPLLVNPVDSVMPDVYSFDIERRGSDNIILSNFHNGAEEINETAEGKIGTTIKTPIGEITLEKAPWESSVPRNATIHYTHYPVEALAGGLSAQLSVAEATGKGSVLNLSITATSVHKADDILLTLIRIYNDRWLKDRNQIAVATSQFINERLGVIESELGHVDSDISSYKAANLIPDVAAASSMYFNQSADNQHQINELTTQISIARMVKNELATQALDKTIPANLGLVGNNVTTQIGEYNSIVLRRNRILSGSTERNPVVQDLTQSLEQMKANIFESIDNYITTLNTQLSAIRRQEAHTTGKLAANPGQAKYLLSVERQQKVKESLYLFLLQKREENELSQAFTAYNSKIINKPHGSTAPVAPVKSQILLIALLAGAAIPAAILILRMCLNNVVRGRKDLEGLSIPFVAEIPEVKAPKEQDKKKLKTEASPMERIVVKAGSRNVINEAFRVARTNVILLAGKGQAQKVFVLSSFNPGSGKTFVSTNIAASFALKDKRTLIIDCDLRKGSVSKLVDSPKEGISNYLSGMTNNINSLLHNVENHPNLFVLPVGQIPPNPTELLENGRLEEMVAQLRQEFDYIFIDCPPIDIVADTQIISQVADRMIFIIRAGLLERSMLSNLEDIYEEHRFSNLSLLLNATSSGGKSGYGYRYGYRYGYHYGYGKGDSYYGSDK